MNMVKISILGVLVVSIVAVVIYICTSYDAKKTPEQLAEIVNQHLSIGDDREKIIKFLEAQGWPFIFDRFQRRFSATEPLTNKWYGGRNSIYLYVSESDKFLKVEVVTSYNNMP